MKIYNPDGTSKEYKSKKTKLEEMEIGCHIKTPQGTEHHFADFFVEGLDPETGHIEVFGNLDLLNLYKIIAALQDVFTETFEGLSEEDKAYLLFLMQKDEESDEE